MSLKPNNIDKRLQTLLGESYQDGQSNASHLPFRENRIFTNRNIKLTRIQAIGFDMDYTLAQYKRDALDKLTMRLALRTMVEEHGYPERILDIPYNGAFAIRGLVMDCELGNILKMDKFRYVSLAYHGLRPLAPSKRASLYNRERISFNSSRYRPVDTLFELLEVYLFAALVDFVDREKKIDTEYVELYKQLRSAIDLCHRDGSLKQEVMSHPERYIEEDAQLIPALYGFKDFGKQLFVLTNSEPAYTNFMLSFLFRNAAPFFRDWRDCFSIVGSDSRKPLFFKEGHPAEIIEDNGTLFFARGNIEFLEKNLKAQGDKVLYVGDHIYGDILKSKHSSSWRTCIIVPELIKQIRAEQEAKPIIKQLFGNESRRKEITMELNWRRNQLLDLHQFKEAEADELNRGHLERIDERMELLNRQLERIHKELSDVLFESRKLRRRTSSIFNPYWGRLFKTGGQLSVFAEQIRDYACIYTATVSNFNFYGNHAYLQSIITPMPHEDNLFQVGDLNFDASMEGERAIDNQENDDKPSIGETAAAKIG